MEKAHMSVRHIVGAVVDEVGGWMGTGSSPAAPLRVAGALPAARTLDDVVRTGTTVAVCVSDAIAASPDWWRRFEQWLDRGVTIKCLLVNPAAGLPTAVTGIQSARMQLRCVDREDNLSASDRATVARMRTFGFMVGRRPKFIIIQRPSLTGTESADYEVAVGGAEPRYDPLNEAFESIWRAAAPGRIADLTLRSRPSTT
jgi:hypothetical protein